MAKELLNFSVICSHCFLRPDSKKAAEGIQLLLSATLLVLVPVLNGVGNAHLSPRASEGVGPPPQDRWTDRHTHTAAMRLSRKVPQIAEN